MAELLAFPARTLADAAERAAALDITRSAVVEAPAGSGKTGLLLQRLLCLLASETVTHPAQVLAITFTRKATHELRDRVLGQLAAAAAGTPAVGEFDRTTRALAEAVLARDRALGWSLLEQPQTLNIRTIDSLAAEIARALPVLSGSGGALTPADDAGELYAEAARRTLLLLGGEDRALTASLESVLLHRDGNLAECQRLIAEMLAWREQWAVLIPMEEDALDDAWLDEHVLPRFERALDLAICRALTRVQALIPAAALDRLCALASEMALADGNLSASSPMAICRGRGQSPEARAEHLDHWRALLHLLLTPSSQDWRKSFIARHLHVEIVKAHQLELKELVAQLSGTPGLLDALCSLSDLPPARYPQDQWVVARALFRVLRRALVELQLVFTAAGTCDFTELSLLARHALDQDGALEDLARTPALHLQHLLVDEMQDTSTGQYDLLQALTRGWDGHSQTVFLVGDPKQSIYLFRQARVERFLDTLHTRRLGDIPLTRLALTVNFRSQAALVGHFNDDFVRIFPPAAEQDGLSYTPAVAALPASQHAARVWHARALPYERDAALCRSLKLDRAQQDATDIRELLATWQARPLPATRTEPWKLAVLVRSRPHLVHIVEALRAAPALAFRAVEIEPLAERQEILDLLALTRALLHLADRTAWLAVLRAPFCGLGLADLHALAANPDERDTTVLELCTLHAAELSPDGQQRLSPTLAVLHAALARRAGAPLALWVQRTWRALGADRIATDEESANAARFFELLDVLAESTGGLNLDRLTNRLGRLYAGASVHPGAVDLMTIHGAKGLEWDAVCVPALEARGHAADTRLLTWLELDSDGDAAPGILAPIQSKGTAGAQLNAWMRGVIATREAEERKRQVYVACTRARQELHLFAAPTMSAKGELKPISSSLLAAAWPAAESAVELPAISLGEVAPETRERADQGLALAAAAEPATPSAEVPLLRVPLAAMRLPDTTPDEPEPAPPRPQGALLARTVGNVLHAYLELAAVRFTAQTGWSALEAAVPGWLPRIRTLLRAGGLAPAELDRAAATVLRGLTRTLASPEGRWLLSPHPGAEAEQAYTVGTDERTSLRLDRTFLAGAEPHSTGSTHRWIIDWKTATHGGEDLDAFLIAQHTLFAPQLERYAAALATPETPVRLALYYPLLDRLDWWTYVDG